MNRLLPGQEPIQKSGDVGGPPFDGDFQRLAYAQALGLEALGHARPEPVQVKTDGVELFGPAFHVYVE